MSKTHALKIHTLEVANVRHLTDDAVQLTFAVPAEYKDDYQFTQGQHLTLIHSDNGSELRRSYSICSGVDDNELCVAIKRIAGGKFSNHANDNLKSGSQLQVMTPTGQFHTALDPDQSRHYMAFVAGSGITPILSIIKTTLSTEPKSQFTLVYGNRNTKSIMFHEVLEGLKNSYPDRFSLFHILSREKQDLELLNGHINKNNVEKLLNSYIPADEIDDFFLCGPYVMIEEIRSTLEALGINKKNIHFELFATPEQMNAQNKKQTPIRKLSQKEAEQESEVVIVFDGNRTSFKLRRGEEAILDAALKTRSDLPFACKGGVCCTCRAKVEEGEVEMGVNYGLEPDEIEAGFVLTCQSHPISDKVVLNYDN